MRILLTHLCNKVKRVETYFLNDLLPIGTGVQSGRAEIGLKFRALEFTGLLSICNSNKFEVEGSRISEGDSQLLLRVLFLHNPYLFQYDHLKYRGIYFQQVIYFLMYKRFRCHCKQLYIVNLVTLKSSSGSRNFPT